MSNSEAKTLLKFLIQYRRVHGLLPIHVEALETAISALEKQEQKDSPHKEPVSVNAFDGVDKVLTYKCVSCPTCGKWMPIHGDGKGYCQYCGQAVKNNFYNEQE
ncbi:MAG: hypothetical protein LUC83_10070 [Clostridiales bacterium]|nr:hypothetical protein [Clostridiales bacterium]